ncbi:MAG: hypothetical protein K2P87_05735 [Lachnospiraceae bacterium]|nr:hypothetical protein [Lachnospiraceae bacterium]
MDIRMEKKSKLKFQGRKHSKKGILAMFLALLSFAGLIAASLIAAFAKGQAGIMVGYLGMGCFFVALIGFVLGIFSLREPDILHFQPVFGVTVNGILLVALVSLYLTGMMV